MRKRCSAGLPSAANTSRGRAEGPRAGARQTSAGALLASRNGPELSPYRPERGGPPFTADGWPEGRGGSPTRRALQMLPCPRPEASFHVEEPDTNENCPISRLKQLRTLS